MTSSYLNIKALTEKVTKSTPINEVNIPPINPMTDKRNPCRRPKPEILKYTFFIKMLIICFNYLNKLLKCSLKILPFIDVSEFVSIFLQKKNI